MLLVATVTMIGFGVNLAIRGFRSKRWELLVIGVALAVGGGYLGVSLYLLILCWMGIGCI